MSFFSVQVGLLQVTLQNTDTFVSHELCQGEYIRAVPEHGKRKSTPEIVQCRFFHTGCLRSTSENTPQAIITQAFGTAARMGHPQSDAAGSLGRDGQDARAQCAGEVQLAWEVGAEDGDLRLRALMGPKRSMAAGHRLDQASASGGLPRGGTLHPAPFTLPPSGTFGGYCTGTFGGYCAGMTSSQKRLLPKERGRCRNDTRHGHSKRASAG